MTKPVLFMLLGAATASAWWGFATLKHPVLAFFGAVGAFASVVFIAIESENLTRKR